MVESGDQYGGIFVYEISTGGRVVYIVSNPDQINDLLNHPDLTGLYYPDDAQQITIKRLGEVLINPLTLERLVET